MTRSERQSRAERHTHQTKTAKSMLTNVEHIGIAVKDLNSAEELYSKLFNILPYKRETIHSESVNTSFFKINQTKIELLEATDPNSVIAKFIEKKEKASTIWHLKSMI